MSKQQFSGKKENKITLYDYDKIIFRTFALMQKDLSENNFQIMKKFDRVLVNESLSDARLLYVTTYFQAILEYILPKNVELKTEPKVLDKYFENFETNKKLLKLTDEILEQFFDQTLHIRQDDDGRDIMTLHNFFAGHVWGMEAKRILKSIMKRKREQLKEIKNSFK